MRLIAISALLGVTLSACAPAPAYTPSSTYTPPTPEPAAKPIEKGAPYNLSAQQMALVKADTAKSMKDPESARFGKMYAAKDSEGTITVCGYVNGKNSYGGYVGMSPFLGVFLAPPSDTRFRVVRIGSTESTQYAVHKVCRDSGIDLAGRGAD